jgi:hypothetical protein
VLQIEETKEEEHGGNGGSSECGCYCPWKKSKQQEDKEQSASEWTRYALRVRTLRNQPPSPRRNQSTTAKIVQRGYAISSLTNSLDGRTARRRRVWMDEAHDLVVSFLLLRTMLHDNSLSRCIIRTPPKPCRFALALADGFRFWCCQRTKAWHVSRHAGRSTWNSPLLVPHPNGVEGGRHTCRGSYRQPGVNRGARRLGS